jgi:putative transposase
MKRTLPKRKPLRLPNYDYSQNGAYYITICTHHRECVFGEVVDGVMVLNEAGRMVESVWHNLPNHYPNIVLDAFIIMPNHLHFIIFVGSIHESTQAPDAHVGDGLQPSQSCEYPSREGYKWEGYKPSPTFHGLPEIIRGFKTFSSKQINQHRQTQGIPVWQRGYYDHIVRNDADLTRIRKYIANNPAQWALDENNPHQSVGSIHESTAKVHESTNQPLRTVHEPSLRTKSQNAQEKHNA